MERNYFRNLQQSGRSHSEITFTQNYKEPFRISDSVLLVGKYKGIKLTEVSNVSYLKWMINNVAMSTQHKNILRDIVG